MQPLTQGFRPYVLLTLLVLLVALPGLNAVPVIDGAEALSVQATRQMAESGDFVTVRFLDQVRPDAAVGIHWMQAVAVDLLGHPADTRVWPQRLVSVAGLLLAVLMTFRLGVALFDRRIALVGAAVLATSVLAVVEAHLARADAMLLGLITLVMACFGLIYMQGKGGPRAPSWVPLAFWLGLGVAILVKGAVAPLVVLAAALALAAADRGFGWLHPLRPVMGVILIAAVVAPWLLAADGEPRALFGGLVASERVVWTPPGTHALLVVLLLWPGSLVLWPALVRAWRERALPGVRFLLAWLVPAWLIFELIPAKLPQAPLPLYPVLALLIAATLFAVRDGTYDRLARPANRLWFVVWALLGVGLAAGVVWAGGVGLFALVAALAAVVAAGVGLWQVLRRRYLNALAAGMAGAVVLYGMAFAHVLPGVSDLWVAQRTAALADATAPGAPVVAAGYEAPGLVFLMGSNTVLAETGAAAAAALADGRAGVAVLDAAQAIAFRATAAADGLRVQRAGAVDGFDLAQLRPVRVFVYRLAE